MAGSATLLVDEVLSREPSHQWVIRFPYPLHYQFARYPQVMSRVWVIVYRIVMGTQQGQKVLTLQTLPPRDDNSTVLLMLWSTCRT